MPTGCRGSQQQLRQLSTSKLRQLSTSQPQQLRTSQLQQHRTKQLQQHRVSNVIIQKQQWSHSISHYLVVTASSSSTSPRLEEVQQSYFGQWLTS